MNVFFTSDTHFYHTNLIVNRRRPHSSVEEMNEDLIQRWNLKIGKKDIVYHLGDFLWKLKYLSELLSRLNGKITLIKGNHDYKLKAWEFDLFHSVHDILYLKSLNIFLCHYPMLTWHKSSYGSIMLHGHSHGGLKSRKNTMDVGVDTNGFEPYSLEEIKDKVVL